MEDLRNDRLEELCVKLIEKEETSVADEIVEEAVRIIVEEKNIMIDGEVMEDGSVDPTHLLVDLDNRYYFNVYTSAEKFRECDGAHAYVLPLAELMRPIYEEESFGGIAINHKKGDQMILISKEELYEGLQKRIADYSSVRS